MGDLRFRNVKDDSGIWARDFHGAYEGQGRDSRYNGFQLGYDYAANEKSVYGFFGERTISNPKYSYGSSKDHGLSGGLYGTWFGDSGVYTDVVAKWGRDDTSLRTWGDYPDRANYRTRSESLSVEWGKTFTRDDGLFLEPEATASSWNRKRRWSSAAWEAKIIPPIAAGRYIWEAMIAPSAAWASFWANGSPKGIIPMTTT